MVAFGLVSKQFTYKMSYAQSIRAPRSAERRSEKPERGRSATPEIDPERKSERNSEKGRSACWSARSDYFAKLK